MNAARPDGSMVRKVRDRVKTHTGPIPEPEARGLRQVLMKMLRRGGYNVAQIEQITGWAGRTIRRDLASPTPIPAPNFGDSADDLAEDRPVPILGPHPHGPAGLSPTDIAELKREYAANPDAAAWLAGIEVQA